MSSHPKRGKRKEEDMVNASSEDKDNLLPWGARDVNRTLRCLAPYTAALKNC
jgi:hypothetical protein